MSFLALLTKELRSRMRRERTIWTMIAYILLMSLPGLLVISRLSTSDVYGSNTFTETGTSLYILLSIIQLFLILFATPAYTATTVNGEKERRTFDLLLCSQLTAFDLVAGKLVAGMVNALVMVAGSIPLFSLVFFFGGISPLQILTALLIYTITALQAGTYGLFCSTIFHRPAFSTAVTYVSGIIWMITPLLTAYLWYESSAGSQSTPMYNQVLLLFAWNPITALVSTYPGNGGLPPVMFAGLAISLWQLYIVLSLLATTIFFLLSVLTVKPYPPGRIQSRSKHVPAKDKASAPA